MASLEPPQNKTWDLSLYELNRTPQEAIVDNSEIAVSPRSLHSELMCPICLDMLKKTMTTKECLHRFCSDCIVTALRSGNKECPTCRKKLVSKRSLRPDPNFDLLISKIYPSREEYEAHQERVLAKFNQSHSQVSMVNSITEGIKLQSQNRPQRSRKHNDGFDGPAPPATATTATTTTTSSAAAVAGTTSNHNSSSSSSSSAATAALAAAAAAAAAASNGGAAAATATSSATSTTGSTASTAASSDSLGGGSSSGGVGGGGGANSTASTAIVADGSSSSRQHSNPPSVRSTPSPVPSNFSSGTSNKIKRSRSILTASELTEESESNSEVDYSRTEGNDSNVDTEGEGNSELGLNDEIELVFKPHPTEMTGDNPLVKALKENCIRYLKTTANASGKRIFSACETNLFIYLFSSVVFPVDHLSKYLAMRLTLDLETALPEADRLVNFCIYIAPHPSQILMLNGNQTLHQVNDKFWKVGLTKVCVYETTTTRTIRKSVSVPPPFVVLLIDCYFGRLTNQWKCFIRGNDLDDEPNGHRTLFGRRLHQRVNYTYYYVY